MAARLLVEQLPVALPPGDDGHAGNGPGAARARASFEAPFTFEQLREVLVDGERRDWAIGDLVVHRGGASDATDALVPAGPTGYEREADAARVVTRAPLASAGAVDPAEDVTYLDPPPAAINEPRGAADTPERIAEGQIGGDDFALWPGVKLTSLVRQASVAPPAADDAPPRADGLEMALVLGDSNDDLADPAWDQSGPAPSRRMSYLIVARSPEGPPESADSGDPQLAGRGFDLERVVTLERPHLSVGDGVEGDGFAELVSAVREERGDLDELSMADDSPVIWSDRGYQPSPQIDVGIQVYDEPTIIRRAPHGEGIEGDGLDDLLIEQQQAQARRSHT